APVFDFDEQRTYFRTILPIHPQYSLLHPTTINGSPRVPVPNPRYIFTFGNVGSGKSTLMAAAAHVLYRDFPIQLDNKNKEGNLLLLSDWIGQLKRLEFPPRSRSGDIYEVGIGITINKNQLAPLVFLEMAGEDLKRFDKRNGEGGPDERFKKYTRVTEVFLVVAAYDNAADDDLLVWQFFDYLMNEGIGMSRIMLIISKWDLNTGKQDVVDFVRQNMPQTFHWLKSIYKDKPLIYPFSIGTVGDGTIRELRL
ncbi:MAG: hypothetical protein GY940_14700, partial [bacterium]|nr:hypothetical protein [bacterium]